MYSLTNIINIHVASKFLSPFFLYCVKTPTNDDGNFGELEFLCTFVAKSKPLSKTRQSIANRTVSKSLPEHQPIVRNTLLQRVVAFLSKVTKNNLNPLSGPVLFPMKVFYVPPSCPRPAGNAGRRRLFPSVGNAVPRRLGMPFPGSREWGSRTVGNLRFSVSRTVYGELSHTEARRARRVRGQGEWGISDAERDLGVPGGVGEMLRAV